MKDLIGRDDAIVIAILAERSGQGPLLLAIDDVSLELLRSVFARIGRLPPSTVQVLQAAAVLGREFWVDDVACLFEGPSCQVDDALREGVVTGVLDPPCGSRMRFARALLADVLLADLPPVLRSRMHGRAGGAIEARTEGALSPESLSELSRHFLSAPRDVAASKGVHYGLQAAADAMRRLAFEQAAGICERIRAVAPQGDHQLDVAIGLGLGECLWKLGRCEDARSQFRRIYAAAVGADDATTQARAALGFAGPHELGAISAEGLALLEAAVALEGLPNVVLAAVLSRLASAMGRMGELPRARSLAEKALVLARESGDESLVVFVQRGRQYALSHPNETGERLTAARDLVVRTTVRLPDQEAFARAAEISHLIVAGQLPDAEERLRELDVVAERLRQPFHLYCAALWRSSLATARGDFARGQAAAADALALAPEGLDRHSYVMQLLPIHRAFDTTGELIADLDDVTRGRAEPVWGLVLALALAEGGRCHAAGMVLRRFLDETLTTTARDHSWILGMGLVGLLGVALADEHAARVAKAELAPYRERLVTDGSGWMVLDTVAAVLGDLNLLLGKPETALQEFATGAEVARHNMMLPALSRCLLGSARAFGRLGRTVALGESLSEARAIAGELGMPRLLREAEELADQVRPCHDPFSCLTSSERRVVALVAEGLTNPEIGARLYVSPRTVQAHLRNVFAKLNVSTRSELAGRAAQRRNTPYGL